MGLNINIETIKLLEYKIVESLCDSNVEEDFLYRMKNQL